MILATLVRGAIVNLFMLLGFVALFSFTRGWLAARRRLIPSWCTGMMFGCMAVVAMLVPTVTGPGVIFDCRSGVIGAGALVCGPVSALTSLLLPCLYRLYVGGPGKIPGLMEIVLPAILGTLCHMVLRRRHQELTVPGAVICSLIVGFTANLVIVSYIIAFMPSRELLLGAGSVAFVILNAPGAMVLFSTMLVLESTHFAAVETMTDRERRMLHSQKMAAVGQLARKVAHSFANALTGIRGNADLARHNEGTAPEVKRLMDTMIASVDRLARLTGDLLAFSSAGSLTVCRMDLGKCIQGIERMLRETLGPRIQMWIETEPGVGRADIDPDRIEQAVVHLAINASEAMSGAGKLRITVKRADLSEAERRKLQVTADECDVHKGSFALLAVQDTGCGMSEEVISRLFEPFFTTKGHGENAGLGLATVYNIIRAHNGYIEVKTQPGRGTTFLIYMPVKEEPQEELGKNCKELATGT